MGDAKRNQQKKQVEGARLVTFAFSGPDILLSKADAEGLDPHFDRATGKLVDCDCSQDDTAKRAIRFLLASYIGAAFPKGAMLKDREIYAAWQESAQDGAPDEVTMPLSQLKWALAFAERADLAIPAALSHWDRSFADYARKQIESAAPALAEAAG